MRVVEYVTLSFGHTKHIENLDNFFIFCKIILKLKCGKARGPGKKLS